MKKLFWDEAFICVSGSDKLNKAHIQHLESRLITLAKGAQLCQLDTKNTPQLPHLAKAEANSVETYLFKLLFVLRVLGLKIFEQPPSKEEKPGIPAKKAKDAIPLLVIRGILKPKDRLHLIKNPKPGLNITEEKARHATFFSQHEIRWDLDGQTYSLSGLCKKICERFGGNLSFGAGTSQGPLYWAKEGQEISLAELAQSSDS